jgi:hypothetical protein
MGGRHGIVLAIEQATKKNQKYGMTLDGCCLMIIYATTNQ